MRLSNLLTTILLLVGWVAHGQNYSFHDDFSDNSNKWAVKSSSDASMYVSSGNYHFSHKRTKGYWLSHRGFSKINPYRDWEIEVKIQHKSGVNDYGYGLTFARKDNDNEYHFLIAANGYYKIKKQINDKSSNPKDWTKSSYVNTGSYSYNTLRVKRSGSTWSFYVNGNFVHSMSAASWPGKRVGFVVYNKQAIKVDYIKVKQGTSSYAHNKKPVTNYKPITSNYNNGPSKVVFYDDFYDNKKSWAVRSNEEVAMGVSNGHYYFEHKENEYSRITNVRVDNFDANGDWVLESKIRHVGGIENNAFGILFGRKDNDNQFEFCLAANGYYFIKRNYGKGLRNYLNTETNGSWTKSSTVKKGNYVYNTLKVEKKGSNWLFYINGSLVETVRSYSWSGQRIGFSIYKNQRIEADYISLKQIGGKQYVQNNNNYNNNNNNNYYNSAPSIVLYEPQTTRGLTVVKAKTVRVAGKANDKDGVFEVKINGLDAKLLSDGYFSLDVPLAIGQNTINVVATDTKRKSKTQTFKIKREQNYNNPVVNNNPVVSNNNFNNNNVNQKRLALLIGNSTYSNGGSLPNPVNDVRSMKTTLEQLGFTVLKFENCTQKDMRRAMDTFGEQLSSYDIGLFFYAGHGVQVEGNNYLVPTDAALKNKNDVEYDCVDAGRILGKMEASQVKTNIVILDACRDNPFERSWSRSAQGKGLAFMNAPSGSFIAYATSPGKTASDGTGSNGLYTSALLDHIKTPGLTIEDVFKRVRTTVKKKSGGKQVPWESTSLEGTFKFK